jgi:pSer/pThr/pTyr-binding forkhead associated (FHA) protein
VGSLNGTYVDHERVDAARLQDGNEIQVGRFVLTFLLGTGPAGNGGTT